MILIQLSLLLAGCELTSKTNQNFDLDNDGYFTDEDCDDTNPLLFPDSTGVCPYGTSCLDILNSGLSSGGCAIAEQACVGEGAGTFSRAETGAQIR